MKIPIVIYSPIHLLYSLPDDESDDDWNDHATKTAADRRHATARSEWKVWFEDHSADVHSVWTGLGKGDS